MSTLGTTGPDGRSTDYEVETLLAVEGGQGHVFTARLRSARFGEHLVDAQISLKQLISGAVGTERIEEYQDVIRRKRHPALGRQLEVFRGPAPAHSPNACQDADLLYVAAVWVPGVPLSERALDASVHELLGWNSQVAAGLDYLHADLGESPPVLHRDVKPSNIIVTPENAAVLIDPGLARLVDAHVTGTPYGSPGFIPPECDRDPGTASPASDRWQLGATLVAALLGEPPARSLDRVDLRRRLVGRLRKNLASPGPVADEILRMTNPEPGARPSSAAAWAGRLLALEEAGSRPRRRTTMALVGATAVISAALGAGVAVVVDRAMTHAGPAPASNASVFSQTAVVYNKVTSGLEMREDKPAYLSTRPANFCKRDGCALPNTDMSTGAKVTLVCQTIGPRDTNGDDSSPGDDKNPELFESRLWYGVRWPDGRFGFLSDVWLAPDFRGGLGLPLC